MATEVEWKQRTGARIKELRDLKGLSLEGLARETGGLLSKSRISNYEQGTRLPGPEEATILGEALQESPAHILCLDDDMPALSKIEAALIRDLRKLPENDRTQYAERIAMLAKAYEKPVPNDRLMKTAYNPKVRPRSAVPAKKAPAKRAPGPHDN